MLRPHAIFRACALSLLALTFLSACVQKPSPPDSKPEIEVRGGYPIERMEQSNSCFDLEIEYPFLGRPELDQQVRLWVDAHYYAVSDELLTMCGNFPDDGQRPYAYSVTYELFSTPGSISTVFRSWSDTGGAHGQDGIRTLVLAVDNGDDLRYKDIFAVTSGLYTFLSDYVYSTLQPGLGDIWQGSPMFTEGLESVEASFQNFALTPAGLTLYFPTYQIAPYSEGQQVCQVPLAELLKFRPRPGIWQ